MNRHYSYFLLAMLFCSQTYAQTSVWVGSYDHSDYTGNLILREDSTMTIEILMGGTTGYSLESGEGTWKADTNGQYELYLPIADKDSASIVAYYQSKEEKLYFVRVGLEGIPESEKKYHIYPEDLENASRNGVPNVYSRLR